MMITKTSLWSGEIHTMDIPVTEEQLDRVKGGELIQNVLPQLSADQRQFLISGITRKEWDDMCLGEEGSKGEQ